jgi:hypothetical protein
MNVMISSNDCIVKGEHQGHSEWNKKKKEKKRKAPIAPLPLSAVCFPASLDRQWMKVSGVCRYRIGEWM